MSEIFQIWDFEIFQIGDLVSLTKESEVKFANEFPGLGLIVRVTNGYQCYVYCFEKNKSMLVCQEFLKKIS